MTWSTAVMLPQPPLLQSPQQELPLRTVGQSRLQPNSRCEPAARRCGTPLAPPLKLGSQLQFNPTASQQHAHLALFACGMAGQATALPVSRRRSIIHQDAHGALQLARRGHHAHCLVPPAMALLELAACSAVQM